VDNKKLLIVHCKTSKEELKKINIIMLEAAKAAGLSSKQLKAAKTSIIIENIDDIEYSPNLTINRNEFSRVISVGLLATKKIEAQRLEEFKCQAIPAPSSWDKEIRAKTLGYLIVLLNGWQPDTAPINVSIEPKETETKSIPVIKPQLPYVPDTATIGQLEKILELEVLNHRMHAVIFQWSQEGSSLILQKADKKLDVPLDQVVPILVSDDILSDETKIQEVRDALDKSLYKNPYLLGIKDFIILVKIYQKLAKDREVYLRLSE
jgi:hypothetical protein